MKRKSYKSKKKILIIAGVIIFVIIALIGIFILKKQDKNSVPKNTPIEEKNEFVEKDYDTTYILETSFDGTEEIHPAMFAYPFKKSDLYISNKELVEEVSAERLTNVRKRAEELAETFFKVRARELSKDYETYETKFKNMFLSYSSMITETGEELSQESYISNYLKAIVDAKVQTDASFETYKCLIYEDGSYYVRGLLELTVYDVYDEKDQLKYFFPIKLENSTEYEIVLEIGLVTSEENRKAADMKITSIEIIDVISEE